MTLDFPATDDMDQGERMTETRIIEAAFLGPEKTIDYVFGQGRRGQVAQRARLLPEVIGADQLDAKLGLLVETEVVFASWGIPQLTPSRLDRMPRLRAVFYAAGSVQKFALPLLERGILVTSAWRANAVPVAEFTLAQILLSCKGYWRNVREYDGTPGAYGKAFRGPGNYGETVALLGGGTIGRSLIALLRPFPLNIIVFDPFLSGEEAVRLGVEKVGLEEAFSRGYVVSNHLADKPETAGMIGGPQLSLLRPGATFVNTGRGRTVNQPELVAVLRERPDVTALLDVTDPEPLEPGSALWSLPNVRVSSHIAGSIGNEVVRMADSAIAEFDRYVRGEPPLNAVTLDMLATLA